MSFLGELKRRNVIRVAIAYLAGAWLVTEVAGTVLPVFGFGEVWLRGVIVVLAVAFIPTLILSWTFEITPDGFKREVDAGREGSITRFERKTVDRLIVVLLTLAVAYFAFDKFVLDPVEDERIAETSREEGRAEAVIESYGDKSIAVLAFANLSGVPEQEFFSDGVSAELIARLNQVPQLRVTPRTSSFHFKNSGVDLRDIAGQLNVVHILDGSVRRDGDNVRITAELIDAPANTVLWSRTYDRQLQDIIKVQNEVAEAVVAQLELELLGRPRISTETDPQAYMLYLRAGQHYKDWSAEALTKAAVLYEEAVTIDPEFALGWVRLADVEGYRWMFSGGRSETSLQRAMNGLEKALELDPDSAEALALRGSFDIGFERDWASGALHLRQALRTAPTNPHVIDDAAQLLWILGRMGEAIEVYRYLVRIDPVNSLYRADLGATYLAAGMLEDAVRELEIALEISADNMQALRNLLRATLQQGKPEKVRELLAQIGIEANQYTEALLGCLDGDVPSSIGTLETLVERYGERTGEHYRLAEGFAFCGDSEGAFELLEIAATQLDDPNLLLALSEPEFRVLHDDPRWDAFLEQIGLSPGQLAEIKFEVELP